MKLLIEQNVKGDAAQVLLRSRLRAVSRRMGFNDAMRERMELVCNEMATNQNKFAHGTGLIQLWEATYPQPALEVFALDYGPGITNLTQALTDGFTTAKTMGKGLGAVQRLAHDSEFYTIPIDHAPDGLWHGMAVWAQFFPGKRPTGGSHRFGSYVRAYQDSTFNGDLIAIATENGKTRWLHMDGLGHGREAAEVVTGLGSILEGAASVLHTMQALSRQLVGSRGAVAMVCEVDASAQTATICGVGDMIAAHICNGEKKVVNFAPGVLGHAHRSLEAITLPFPPQALLITASDGLRRNWGLRSFPELWRLKPQMVALILGQIGGRSNDDKSVFAINTEKT